MSGYACLIDSTEGEDGYAQIVAGHFGSKSRFNQYIKNMIFLNQQSITVKNMDCELTGNGVDPISCCFNNINWNSWVPEGGRGLNEGLHLGENVKFAIKINNIPRYGGKFEFSYYLNGIRQNKKKIAKDDEITWVIENYLFENGGYPKLLLDTLQITGLILNGLQPVRLTNHVYQ